MNGVVSHLRRVYWSRSMTDIYRARARGIRMMTAISSPPGASIHNGRLRSVTPLRFFVFDGSCPPAGRVSSSCRVFPALLLGMVGIFQQMLLCPVQGGLGLGLCILEAGR